ncbi:hypothetical protein EOY42_05195 [Salmonella enterica]|nr:hypothetical protein [Salmonella enterica]
MGSYVLGLVNNDDYVEHPEVNTDQLFPGGMIKPVTLTIGGGDMGTHISPNDQVCMCNMGEFLTGTWRAAFDDESSVGSNAQGVIIILFQRVA